MHAYTIDHTDNSAWYRQMAAGWARRMIKGETPGEWANNTESDVLFAISQLDLLPGDRVLDLGCGWGRHSLMFAAYGLRVTGLDLSRDLLALARYNARRHNLAVNWVEGDLAHPPLRGPFGAIAQFCGNFMTWFPDPDTTFEVLWNLSGLLRPGGRMLFGDEEWCSDLPSRAQTWDEWPGGAAIYRHRYDHHTRISETQTVVFGPGHARQEFRRQTWWPSSYQMESLFAQAGLMVCARYNNFVDYSYDPEAEGLVYVLARED